MLNKINTNIYFYKSLKTEFEAVTRKWLWLLSLCVCACYKIKRDKSLLGNWTSTIGPEHLQIYSN